MTKINFILKKKTLVFLLLTNLNLMFRFEEIGLGFKDSYLEFKIYDIKFKIII